MEEVKEEVVKKEDDNSTDLELNFNKPTVSELLKKKGLDWKIIRRVLNIGLVLFFIVLVVYMVINRDEVFAQYKYIRDTKNCTETYKNNILISPKCNDTGSIGTTPKFTFIGDVAYVNQEG